MKWDWNEGWTVYSTPAPEEWDAPREEETVDLPHDRQIRLTPSKNGETGPAGGYYPGCSAEYEKKLFVPEAWKDKLIYLEFDGVYHNAVLWVNNRFAVRRPSGYALFRCEISGLLRPGSNRIRVSASNTDQPNSRWYTGTGIYRGVTLWVKNRVCLSPGGIALTARRGERAAVLCRAAVMNASDKPAQARLLVRMEGPQGERMQAEAPVFLRAEGESEAACELPAENARWWSDRSPYLYRVVVSLFCGDECVDECELSYGLRTVELSPEKGLLLNGEPVKLRGGCLHHVAGIFGAASFYQAEERRIRLLRECGFNAVRSAHNPASEALLAACDRLGMLVVDEAFDMWRVPKRQYDDSRFFDAWWRRDIAAMVERDRNHPSVILYSSGNELPERDGSCGGAELSRQMAAAFRELDPTRPVMNALCFLSPEGEQGLEANLLESAEGDFFSQATREFTEPLDVVGYNYMPERFGKDRLAFPHRLFCATESAPAEILRSWEQAEKYPFVIGDFVWTAMDYIGEAGIGRTVTDGRFCGLAAYPFRLAGTGDLDLCGRKRPRSFFRDCVWGIAKRPYLAVESPALFGKKQETSMWGWPLVQEKWNYPGMEGMPVRVTVYSMAEQTALYLNGRKVGMQPAGREHAFQAVFSLLYEPGTLTAVDYQNGEETGRSTIHTPGPAARIRLTAESRAVKCSRDGIVFVHAELVDAQGIPVLLGSPSVRFSVRGGGCLLAAGTAAIETTVNYTDPNQRLDEGYAQAVIRTNGKREAIEVFCTCGEYPCTPLAIPVQE